MLDKNLYDKDGEAGHLLGLEPVSVWEGSNISALRGSGQGGVCGLLFLVSVLAFLETGRATIGVLFLGGGLFLLFCCLCSWRSLAFGRRWGLIFLSVN
ncbi:hypothetical protein B0T26DRAFT_285474 [Lasiosphaeria miniovina]|uniref:Uncharacterized protein n=1 Tax=Lasiosphaeria miniovina TaxID=1954250 RepID=A0AA40AJR9_9PEZI|nr:uncharacterized protein B0T26DRAFT_285474 [Lasiosphaeria miniovina]KAK0717166.1 hypothetical protein B0T26DRAFT_285474 [Lasiosphaeria miniovina]